MPDEIWANSHNQWSTEPIWSMPHAHYTRTDSLWISVEDRLPPTGENFLGWLAQDEYVETLMIDKDGYCWNIGSGNRWGAGGFEKIVTHWMPIPPIEGAE